MDQGPLVESQIDEGREIVEKLKAEGFDVTAAWWMKTAEEGQWFLYIASQQVDTQGIATAYRTLYSHLRPLRSVWVDRFDVKLVGRNNPIAIEVCDLLRRYPGPMPIRYGGKRLGNVSIE